MYRLGECELIYINQDQDSNYNPVITEHRKTIKCKLMDAFSVNYYQNQSRDMRKSKNIIIPKTYTNNVVIEGKSYQLEMVNFRNEKYKITNILIDRNSTLTFILDCEQIINE